MRIHLDVSHIIESLHRACRKSFSARWLVPTRLWRTVFSGLAAVPAGPAQPSLVVRRASFARLLARALATAGLTGSAENTVVHANRGARQIWWVGLFVAGVLAAQIAAAAPVAAAAAPVAAAAAPVAAAAAPAAKPEKPTPPAATPPAATPPSEPGATHKVARELLKLELNLKGVYEPVATHEITVQTDSWATLEVAKAVEHGQSVKKSDLLLQLDTEKIDEAIADLQMKRASTELSIQQSEAALKALRATTPLDLKAAERAMAIAQEDLARYLKIDRGLAEKSAALQLKSAEQMLENQRDELRQLEKMYKADDLTEETEEIVLKRQRRAVEAAEFMLETSRAAYQDSTKIEIPRKQETLEVAAQRQETATAKAKVSVPAVLAQAERDLEKAKIEKNREDEKLKKLQADREKLVIRSPIDGVVYYGRFARGKWSAAEGATETLKPGAAVLKGAVVMTVAQLRPLAVRASVGEAEIRHIRAGLQGTSRPTALPEVRVPVAVERVDAIPTAADSFEVRLRITADTPNAIVPGMGCTVRLLPYVDRNALAVPSKAVFTDEIDDLKTFVYVQKDGKPEKRDVVVGHRIDDKAEIVRGLAEGDEILLERPKPPAKDAAAKPSPEKKPEAPKSEPKPEPKKPEPKKPEPKKPEPKQPEPKKPSPPKPIGK